MLKTLPNQLDIGVARIVIGQVRGPQSDEVYKFSQAHRGQNIALSESIISACSLPEKSRAEVISMVLEILANMDGILAKKREHLGLKKNATIKEIESEEQVRMSLGNLVDFSTGKLLITAEQLESEHANRNQARRMSILFFTEEDLTPFRRTICALSRKILIKPCEMILKPKMFVSASYQLAITLLSQAGYQLEASSGGHASHVYGCVLKKHN